MTEKPSTVRLATVEDEAEIYNLLCLLHEENALWKISPAKVVATIKKATERRGGIIGVVDGPNGIEGTVGMVIEEAWYSDKWQIIELWNFVHPECRQSHHAKNLIQFSKWMAEQMDLALIMGIFSSIDVEQKIRLYSRQIMLAGAIFAHNLEDAGAIQRNVKECSRALRHAIQDIRAAEVTRVEGAHHGQG